jgi:hypothetical protein
LAELRASGDQREVHFDTTVIITGVPRDPDFLRDNSPPLISKETESEPSSDPAPSGLEEPVASETSILSPPYIWVATRQATEDGDPGQIAEAWVTVEGGCVTLTDRDGKHVNSRAMLKGEDPAALARVLLHEARAGTDFNWAISYQKSGVA